MARDRGWDHMGMAGRIESFQTQRALNWEQGENINYLVRVIDE